MNAVEIEETVSDLVEQPFDPAEFPLQFLAAFGNKDTTLKRLRSGSSNASDVPGGVLQRNNIHIAVAPRGAVPVTLAALRESPKTVSGKAKFILATDGILLEAEDLLSGETIASDFADLAQHFGFFLPLAGISTVKEIKNNPIDVKATGRLNKLYVELLKDNPDWATEARRKELNQFMARLIFCFFAEDTGIFVPQQFTDTITQMSDSQSNNTHEVLIELFRAMDMKKEQRATKEIRSWSDKFPYVNGGLFIGTPDCPRFSRIARSYLLRAGELNWKEINPDIFGSMIQAVADDDERGEVGMHYTSVPNILKVLNPLFLDGLREQLDAAGDNARRLRNLRKRLSNIRVFDPACGSGNFLVIAYKEMRAIEAEVIRRLGHEEKRSVIPLSNFYGIEIRGFAVEITRLALLIAEFQADCLYLSQQEARSMVLPLHKTGQIHVGNALRLDWLEVCPPATRVSGADQRFTSPTVQSGVQDNGLDEMQEPEIYICGNPPFSGSRKQSPEQKADLDEVFSPLSSSWKNVDYVGAWFMKAALYNTLSRTSFAFVATNSFCQGQQVSITWKLMLQLGVSIRFAHTSFRWNNLAANKAGVTVIVVGLDSARSGIRRIFEDGSAKSVDHINPYLTAHPIDFVAPARKPICLPISMDYGVYYSKSEGLMLDFATYTRLLDAGFPSRLTRHFLGSTQFINGVERYCLWLEDDDLGEALLFPEVAQRINSVRRDRLATTDSAVNKLAARPHQFRERKGDDRQKIFVPIVSSVNRDYLPAGIAGKDTIPSNKAFFIPNAPLWTLSILVSRLHLSWIATVCGHLRNDYSYSNILGWNTFPVPKLTEQHRTDLNRCAENILLARETHFPATIADLYDPETMPENLRHAHTSNDELVERIYIGRRFRNDTERLEKLFELYTKMVTNTPNTTKKHRKRKVRIT